jgi:hypothetical protein
MSLHPKIKERAIKKRRALLLLNSAERLIYGKADIDHRRDVLVK